MPRSWIVFLIVIVPAAAGCLSSDDRGPGSKPALAQFTDCDGPIPGDEAPLCENHFEVIDAGQERPRDWYCVTRLEMSGPRVMEIYRSPTGDAFGVWWTVEIDAEFSGVVTQARDGGRWHGNFTGGSSIDFVRISSSLRDGDEVGLTLYRTPYRSNTTELQGGRLEQFWSWSDDGGSHVTHRLRTDDGTWYFPGNDLRSYRMDGRDFDLTIRFPKYIGAQSGGVSLVTPDADCHLEDIPSVPAPVELRSGAPG